MKSAEIRKAFLDFFEEKGHKIVPSAPVVIKDDPTLMFTNAGMNQFKDLFLGVKEAKDHRIADTQKCLRVSGKHNDLEEVGVDTYHHTLFEMLGNWSFGNYFKKEAIQWAWELLTEVYQIPKDQLYVTVFKGDEADGVAFDQEAFDYWKALIDEDRIILADKKDNFWEMGEQGPCGPCSEIHVDIRPESDRAKGDGKSLVNEDHPQVIEIWNLVFMEYNRLSNGSLVNLPNQHVDTGMGFERLAAVLQKKGSNYDTDVFQPIIRKIEAISGKKYTATDDKKDVAIRVISDHVRAVAFSIADGQLPSNNGAGYVIRRILRRAIRYAYSFLDLKESFIYQLVEVLDQEMGAFFPEIRAQRALVEKVIKEEEETFLRTLVSGLQKFNTYLDAKPKQVDGDFAFELYDTYGFPIDLTALLAQEKELKVDFEAFDKALLAQKERSRSAAKVETDDWQVLIDDKTEEFVGYDHHETQVRIAKYRKVVQKNKSFYQLVFNLTPFYAEGGGQVGDQGWISNEEESVVIFDTKKEHNEIIHFAKSLPQNPEAIFTAKINADKRRKTERNHSATHLLHYVLRKELGTHVEQKGSLVNADYLRFDFSHFEKISEEQLLHIENEVNALILANEALGEFRNIPIQEAQDKGAMMLFGEKYGDTVRMIQFGDSKELCGGCHVSSTGAIGSFRFVAESSVASGVRRVEAVTGEAALQSAQENEDLIKALKEALKVNKDVLKAVQSLQDKNAAMEQELKAFAAEQGVQFKKQLLASVEDKGTYQWVSAVTDIDNAEIKNILFQLKNEVPNLVAVVGTTYKGKPGLNILIADALVADKDWNAGKMVREAAKHIQGGGGGQAFFANAGGKKVEGLQDAIDTVKTLLV